MRRVFTCVLCFTVVACSRDLSRTEVAEKIKQDDSFRKRKQTIVVTVGRFCGWSDQAAGLAAVTMPEFNSFLRLKRHDTFVAVSAGLVDVVNVVGYGPGAEEIPPELRQTCMAIAGQDLPGRILHSGWTWTQEVAERALQNGVSAQGGSVDVAFPAFGTVTGLSKNGDGTVDAEFTWKWVPTEIASKLQLPIADVGDRAGVATFTLYDDGWRIDRFVR